MRAFVLVVSLLGGCVSAAPAPVPPASPVRTQKLADDCYRLGSVAIEELRGEGPAAARLVPWVVNTELIGFKLADIRSTSALAEVGLQNGDAVYAINGRVFSDVNGVAPHASLIGASSVSLSFVRDGKPRSVTVLLASGAAETCADNRRKVVAVPEPPPVPETPRVGDVWVDDMFSRGITKIDDTTFELARALVDTVLAEPWLISRGARVVPAVKDGKPNGFKLYAIRPSSVFAKVGFMNGDTLHGVNGITFESVEKSLEAFDKIKGATRIEVSISRRGKPITLTYTIK